VKAYLNGPVARIRLITVAEAASGLIGIRGAFFGAKVSGGTLSSSLSSSAV
jgi:hypothetical protein